ncbi:hypothetical protein DVH24_020906 [Malus domestica]|uniref:Uncharacterized protein n=1 Tax=Malus domestica TaxID=3750 RepID=A0A498JDI3_MALDO|nr:hypothetical protein DVH24_020906 [Malus domestica]
MGDPLGSSCVSSQKQNNEGVVGAQSRQYRATAKPILGCDRMVSEPLCLVVRVCRRGRRAPKGGWIHQAFGNSLVSGSIGTLKLSEFEREHSYDG